MAKKVEVEVDVDVEPSIKALKELNSSEPAAVLRNLTKYPKRLRMLKMR